MPLMGSLYVGTSGLQTSQNALNTTAHNLSNMDTTGFVRQQVLQGDRFYNTIKAGSTGTAAQQVGLGVTYASVRQVRDFFLDQSFRRESGRSAFYDTSYNSINEVEDLLNELNDDASFNQSLTDFWSSLQELAKTPDDTSVQRMVIQDAQTFLTNATQVYQGLIDYQNELNTHIREKVERINELGQTIRDMNDKIRGVEVGGIENANDFRDVRNSALDELAGLGNISYSEDLFGSVSVKFEGADFVCSDVVFKMDLDLDTQTGFYTPFWPYLSKVTADADGDNKYDISNAKVYNLTQTISSELNTDVGELRAMLYARGDKVANYTDIPKKPATPVEADYATPAEYADAVTRYNEDMDIYEKKVVKYNQTISQSICMNIMSEFDQLIHNIATTVNGVLYDAYVASNGTVMADPDYGNIPLEIFQRISCEAFSIDPVTGLYVSNAEDSNLSETLFSIPNLQINPSLLREAGKLKFVSPDDTVDYDTAKALIDAFDENTLSLNPNVTTLCSINTYYSNLVSQVANSGAVYKNISLNQQATVDSIKYSREQVIGVSSDEELTSMVKYQNAFNASSRYINVVDEMLEHIINSLG